MTDEQKKAIKAKIKANYSPADIFAHVHQLKANEARDLFMDGTDAMIDYMFDHGLDDWIEEMFIEPLREDSMEQAELVVHVSYDPEQVQLENIVGIVEHSTVNDALGELQNHVGDGVALMFGTMECRGGD